MAEPGRKPAIKRASNPPAGETPLRAASDLQAVYKESEPAAGEDGVGAAPIRPEEVLRETDSDWTVAPASVDFEDPLVSCLALLSALQHRPISAQALKAGLPLDANGQRMSPELAVRAAERAGLTARLVHRPRLSDIAPVTMPCILLLKGRNACVLLRLVEGGRAEIALAEGGGGTQTVTLEALAADYQGYAIYARPKFQFDARSTRFELGERRPWFWGTLWRFWPIYSHVLIASLLINCFVLASPLFVMNVYDRVVPNQAIETMWVLALGVAIVFLFEFLLRNLRSYFVDIAGKNADVIIASNLLQHVMGMRLDQKPTSTGALAANLREFEGLRDFFTSGTLTVFVDLPFIFLFLGVVWLIAGPLALIGIVAVPIVIGVGLLLQTPLKRVVERSHQESAQKNALLIEAIEGLETIKSAAAESRIQGMWERAVGTTAESSGQARTISTFATTFAQFAVQAVSVGVIIYGVYLIGAGELTMGALVACTILTGRALSPLGAIAALIVRWQHSRVALKALDELMKKPVERAHDQTFLHVPRLEGNLEYKAVDFTYPGQQVPALTGLSIKVRAGERVGILGRIGSGKSTLGRMSIGLYQPAEGAVLMDGMDLRQIDPADLRRNVGYVSQDNYLFYGTVRENICFGAPHVDDAAIMRAAGIAGVSDFLKSHPMGFNLAVGERGMGLSGGQRQSIAIARALVLDPPVLLLDEPTSNMDNTSEARFRQRLGEILPGKTLILITHRSSLLALVDRLVVIDGGRAVADGPKEEVLQALKDGRIRTAR